MARVSQMQNDQNIGFSSIKLEPDGSLVDLRAAALEATANAISITKEDSLERGDWLKLWRAFLKRLSLSLQMWRDFICVAVECELTPKKSVSVALGYSPDSSHPPIVIQGFQEPPSCCRVLGIVVLLERLRFEIAVLIS